MIDVVIPVELLETSASALELVSRRKPSRVLDQLRLSEIWRSAPMMRERSSEAIPISLSVQLWLRPPLTPKLAEPAPFSPLSPSAPSPFKNQDTVMSSAARCDSPNCCWRVFEALSTSLKALPMLSLVEVPLTLSFERERVAVPEAASPYA